MFKVNLVFKGFGGSGQEGSGTGLSCSVCTELLEQEGSASTVTLQQEIISSSLESEAPSL